MCDATTVADYKCLEMTLNEIAEENVEIRPFVLFWEPQKSHAFKPFHGGGLPGGNMLEQGNKTFKPSLSLQAMRLVHESDVDDVEGVVTNGLLFLLENDVGVEDVDWQLILDFEIGTQKDG